MGTFDGVGRGLPSLGTHLRKFVQFARRQEAIVLLGNQTGGARLVQAIQELIRAYDDFIAPTKAEKRIVLQIYDEEGGA